MAAKKKEWHEFENEIVNFYALFRAHTCTWSCVVKMGSLRMHVMRRHVSVSYVEKMFHFSVRERACGQGIERESPDQKNLRGDWTKLASVAFKTG